MNFLPYLLTFFFLVTAHYFRWDEILPWKLPHPIRIIMNYVIGTVGMLVPFTLWLLEHGQDEIVVELLKYVVAAGLAPTLSYLYDAGRERAKALRETKQKLKDAEAREQAAIEHAES